jgi:TolA-binding protein
LFRRASALAGALAALACLATPAPALAQDEISDSRIRKIEAEIRALQRRVFPGGDGRFFEPEITAPEPSAPVSTAPTGATGVAATDLLQRLTALERELRRLTAQGEETQNTVRLLTERVEALEASATAVSAPSLPTEGTIERPDAQGGLSPAALPTGNTVDPPQVSQPSPERLAAVAAVVKPATDDPADDEYVYGFRLWDAGLYPEAQQQLTNFVETYPSHWRTTYGRNLLGRAYLDDGKPRDAAAWFLQNYNAEPNAARGPDSLLFLAMAMIALDDTERACIALAEFAETFPALAAGRLSGEYEQARRQVRCA